MSVKEKELREGLRLGIKSLIFQEVRLLQLERSFTPPIIIDEISRSIQEIKKEIIQLTREISERERTLLLKKMLRQAVDEEIDHLVELRKTRCIRCVHGRFYDEIGTAHVHLPLGDQRAQSIGCDEFLSDLRDSCVRFVEVSIGPSTDHFLNEVTLLYEFRDLIDQIEEIWRDYLTKP